MFFDMQEVMVECGFMLFPDNVIANIPRQDPIIEQVVIGGVQTNSISMTGATDRQE